MSGPYKPTQREYTMENLNTQMDDQLKNRVAELNRANDENRDGSRRPEGAAQPH